jgi:Ca2+-transporting ATPase
VSPSPPSLWHQKAASAIITELATSAESGLSAAAAQENLQKYGTNSLTETPPRSGFSIFLNYFKSVPVALLSAAALLSALTGGTVDAAVIMGVVAINAILGYATESQSERIIQSLKHLVKPTAWVLRDGKLQEINAPEIAIGDIISLKPGTYIPADARLLAAERLSLDESALTGESLPVEKEPEALSNSDIPLAERRNMVYLGTFVTGGQGLAVAVATGNQTEMGQIQTLVGETSVPQTPMERQLERAGGQLVALSGAVCAVVFLLGLARGYGTLPMLKTAIALAVAAVPEGLPTVATTTLALGVRTMRQHRVLIRRLDAVEALGAVQTICLDKTGTLTANQMSVVELVVDAQQIAVAGDRFSVGERQFDPNTCDSLLKLIHSAILCNESQVNCDGNAHYTLNGSATEKSLLQMALAAGIDVLELQAKYPRLATSHRSQSQNFMVTAHAIGASQQFLAVKGNPTEVLALCQWQLTQEGRLPLTEADRQAIASENDRMAGEALRVLGAAFTQGSEGEVTATAPADLTWLGLIGIADPLRPGVKKAIADFHRAGIETVMITGDQAPTASAIGKELNLSQGEPLEILDSTDLTEIAPELLKDLCERVQVFARVSPANKLQIVQALQRAGKVVAMTGDGINDAPALKAAEVGIAMGHSGTDVAREVADVVLEDDNLETMIIAVSQGRTIYNNIRKAVHFLLATNLSEILVMLLANIGGWGQPLNALQLLWLNLVTDIFPGLALAMESPEPDVLCAPPRPAGEPILKAAELQRIAIESAVLATSTCAAYVYSLLRYGISPHASTVAFMSLVTGQLLHALSCRSAKSLRGAQLPPNLYLNVALGASLSLQFASLLFPGLRDLLQVTPIDLWDGVAIACSALLPLLINEVTKSRISLNSTN